MKTFFYGMLTGAVMLIVNLLAGQGVNAVAPSLQSEYVNSGLFRPWSDPLMWLMFLQPFMVGVLLAFIWQHVKTVVPGKTADRKGLNFGLVYFLFSLPGMIMSYSSFPLSLTMVTSWTFGIFVQSLAAGWLLARLMKSASVRVA